MDGCLTASSTWVELAFRDAPDCGGSLAKARGKGGVSHSGWTRCNILDKAVATNAQL